MTSLTLEQCLAARRDGASTAVATPSTDASPEAVADALFIAGNSAEALDAYAACLPRTPALDAKQGYCLAAIDRFDEAASLLTEENCAESPTGLAVLAVALAGGWETWGLGDDLSVDEGAAVAGRKTRARAALDLALAVESPPSLAFYVYQSLVPWYRDREAALNVAERACTLYSIEWLDVWRCQLLRSLDRADHSALDAVLARLPGTDDPETRREAFAGAVALGRLDDAMTAIAEEEAATAANGQVDGNMGLLRAWVALRQGLAGDADAGVQAIEGASAWLHAAATGEAFPSPSRPLAALKIRLAAGVLTGDDAVIRRAAIDLMDVWDEDDSAGEYGPDMEMVVAGGLMHEIDCGEGYKSPLVAKALASGERERWQFHLALRTHLHIDGDDEDALDDIRMYGPAFTPGWALREVASILIDDPASQMRDGGRLLAMHCLWDDDAGEEADLSDFQFDQFSQEDLAEFMEGVFVAFAGRPPSTHSAGRPLVDAVCNRLFAVRAYETQRKLADLVVEGNGDTNHALFHAALARQNLMDLSGAKERYIEVLAADPSFRVAYGNLALVYAELGDVAAIDGLMAQAERQAPQSNAKWAETRALLTSCRVRAGKTDPGAAGRRARGLAGFPALSQEVWAPADLSFAEAAVLLALLRACDMNHATWTLAPFERDAVPFEPTASFRSVLFSLARKGIVRMAETSAVSAFVEHDGEIRYVLGKIEWQVSPATLALQRALRECVPSRWPGTWPAQAEAFIRDVAVEECTRHMKHLTGKIGVVPPKTEDARPIFRTLLEHGSVGQVVYFIDYCAKSALAFGAEKGANDKAMTTVFTKRLIARGERAVEKGWTYPYDRDKSLPRSHLEAVVHDVLTRWGQRAFAEPLGVLYAETVETPDDEVDF